MFEGSLVESRGLVVSETQRWTALGSLTLQLALAGLLLAIPLVVLVTWGNLRPDQISFLPAMRYYAGNWATSLWAFTPSAIAKIDAHIPKSCGFVKSQLKRLYSEQVSEIVTHKGYVYRAMHHHGRALFGLLPRAAGPDHEDAIVIEGELVAGALLGWNFGDGHLHNEQLVAAVASRCGWSRWWCCSRCSACGTRRSSWRPAPSTTGCCCWRSSCRSWTCWSPRSC